MPNYARIEDGVAAEVIGYDPAGLYHPSLVWVACPDDVAQGWQYDGTGWLPPSVTPPSEPDPTGEAYAAAQVQAAIDAAVARLQSEKWAKLLGKYTDSAGHTYDVDNDSRVLLTGKITTINAGKSLPEGFVWKTAEVDAEGQPVYVAHTDASLKALAFEIDDWTQATFAAAEAAQKAVREAGSLDAVAAAEAAVAWPS